jgi:hypothetical protein
MVTTDNLVHPTAAEQGFETLLSIVIPPKFPEIVENVHGHKLPINCSQEADESHDDVFVVLLLQRLDGSCNAWERFDILWGLYREIPAWPIRVDDQTAHSISIAYLMSVVGGADLDQCFGLHETIELLAQVEEKVRPTRSPFDCLFQILNSGDEPLGWYPLLKFAVIGILNSTL